MSLFGYLRHRYFLAQPSPKAAQTFLTVAGTTWSTFSGTREDRRYIFRENGQVEIYHSSYSFKNNEVHWNELTLLPGKYYWQQRENAIYIRGGYLYPVETLNPGDSRREFKIEYIGLISEEPLKVGAVEGIQLRGVTRDGGPWFLTKQPA